MAENFGAGYTVTSSKKLWTREDGWTEVEKTIEGNLVDVEAQAEVWTGQGPISVSVDKTGTGASASVKWLFGNNLDTEGSEPETKQIRWELQGSEVERDLPQLPAINSAWYNVETREVEEYIDENADWRTHDFGDIDLNKYRDLRANGHSAFFISRWIVNQSVSNATQADVLASLDGVNKVWTLNQVKNLAPTKFKPIIPAGKYLKMAPTATFERNVFTLNVYWIWSSEDDNDLNKIYESN